MPRSSNLSVFPCACTSSWPLLSRGARAKLVIAFPIKSACCTFDVRLDDKSQVIEKEKQLTGLIRSGVDEFRHWEVNIPMFDIVSRWYLYDMTAVSYGVQICACIHLCVFFYWSNK